VKAKILHSAEIADVPVRFIASPVAKPPGPWAAALASPEAFDRFQKAGTPWVCVDDIMRALTVPRPLRRTILRLVKDRVAVSVDGSVANFIDHQSAVGIIDGASAVGHAPKGSREAYVRAAQAAYVAQAGGAR